jgi:hypothetical protein
MSKTATAIIRAIREVAEEQPDHVYQKPSEHGICHYVDKNSVVHPGCLVGHGLWRNHLIDASLYGDDEKNGSGVANLLQELDIHTTFLQKFWLTNVQELQDFGNTWGEAVRRVDVIIRDRYNPDDAEWAELLARTESVTDAEWAELARTELVSS